MKKPSAKQIGYYLERTTRMVKLGFSQAFARMGLDLTPEQWVIMESLYYQNGQSQTDLASASFKDAPTISRILDVLGRKKYIVRRRFKNDRRRYKIYLTDLGVQVVNDLQPEVRRLRDLGWENLDEEDYEVFMRITNQIFKNFEKEKPGSST